MKNEFGFFGFGADFQLLVTTRADVVSVSGNSTEHALEQYVNAGIELLPIKLWLLWPAEFPVLN